MAYIEYVSLGIPIDYVPPFSRQIAYENAGPRFSIGVYGSKTIFLLSYFKYWSNGTSISGFEVQTVGNSETRILPIHVYVF